MRPLPTLTAGPKRWTLPMSDHSASALVELLLSEDRAESIEPLVEALAGDPPLLLWSVCLSGRRDGVQSGSIEDVSRWLAQNVVDVLQWDPDRRRNFAAWETEDAPRYADQVAKDLQVADLAAVLAASDGAAAAEKAYLVGLLHHARHWLAMAASRPADGAADRLLEPLAAFNDHPAAAHVAQAIEIVDGRQPPQRVDIDLEACRQRAAEGRRQWLEPLPGPIGRLPDLTRKLGRLEQLERQFQRTLENEKLAALAEFAAGAGHEINNPLAVIGGRAQLLLKQETDPERRRELALIIAQVKRAYEMIADMRLFARPPKPELERFDLVALVRAGEAGPLEIEADPVQLNVALRALCTNALEAIGYDGHVRIDVSRAADSVAIRVADDGPGIPAEHRRHVFDPFYSARQAGRGLGLGLSKCWRIVTNHGGRIDVESPPERGTALTITLPGRA